MLIHANDNGLRQCFYRKLSFNEIKTTPITWVPLQRVTVCILCAKTSLKTPQIFGSNKKPKPFGVLLASKFDQLITKRKVSNLEKIVKKYDLMHINL